MNILFVNANLNGHIHPTLGTVTELTQRGHNVDYYCSEQFEELMQQCGAVRIPFSSRMEKFLATYRPTDRHPFFMLLEYMLLYSEAVLPEVIELINKNTYDLIICDSIFGSGCFLRKLTNIPVAVSHSSFAMSRTPVPDRMLVPGFHTQLDHCYAILERICNTYGIEQPTLTQFFVCKGERNLVYTTQNFNGNPDIHTPEYLFAGPNVNREQDVHKIDFLIPGKRKIIYISLGSLNTDFIEFYQMCITAFENTQYYVYMSIGKKCEIAQLQSIPQNFYVDQYLPQLAILAHADAFVTHAGFNSVSEALYYGVPMLALPQVNDQSTVAKRLTAMELGLTEDIKTLTPQRITEAVAELIDNRKYRENCLVMSQEMQNDAQLPRAVDELEKYVATRQQ